jgi:glutathione S-transferase
LSAAERGAAWAFEKLAEDQLYWALVHDRWLIDDNFNRGPKVFFAAVPAPLRAIIVPLVKRQVRRDLHGQGFARHTQTEIDTLAARAVDALAAFIAERPYLMGEQPCAADAAVFAQLLQASLPAFDSALRRSVERHTNLVAYVARMRERYLP